MCVQVRDERKAQEVFDLADYERSEELRKAKSRSKKNHSRFTVLRCRRPGNTVSPEHTWNTWSYLREAMMSQRDQTLYKPPLLSVL